MISKRVIELFQTGLNEFDKELEDYKKDNKIDKPIFHHYLTTLWLIPPYLSEEGVYIDPKTPDFIEERYRQIYNSAVIQASKS